MMRLAYLKERFRPAIYGPAAVCLMLVSIWASHTRPTPAAVVLLLGSTFLLLLQFRLWDDLEDRERDRRTHPTRVLVVSPVAPFRRMLLGLAIANLALFAALAGTGVTAGLVLLDLLALLSYRVLRRWISDRMWRLNIVLLKYPAFVALLAWSLGIPENVDLTIGMFAVYVGSCVYEVVHDRSGPAEAGRHAERGGSQ